MSRALISRSPDLQRLWTEGYDLEVHSGRFLLVKSVPYVNERKEVRRGTLVSTLTLAGGITTTPDTHVATFIGEHPCRQDGTIITGLIHGSGRQELDRGLVVDHSFSNKRSDRPDADYYEKMTRYIDLIGGYAQALEPGTTARVNRFTEAVEEDSPFHYADTASSNVGVAAVNRKLELPAVAIVGCGSTGAYVLDLVAKTPVREIHLYDGDVFLQHNAFRCPGAAAVEELQRVPLKVEYLAAQYGRMHRGIVPHDCYLDASSLEPLRAMSFVFLCFDQPMAKRAIVEALLGWNIPFIDVGMDVAVVDEQLGGVVTLTTATPDKHDHLPRRISWADPDPKADYSRPIQIADLNALNAALAVIRWKKHCGFYRDFGHEHYAAYSIDTNTLVNEETVP